jgi:hypothetical protein
MATVPILASAVIVRHAGAPLRTASGFDCTCTPESYRAELREVRSLLTTASITSTVRGPPSGVTVEHRDGLGHDSAINIGLIATIPRVDPARPIGVLLDEQDRSGPRMPQRLRSRLAGSCYPGGRISPAG